MLKIFLSGLYQETNTFCPVLTDLGFFQRAYLLQGHSIQRELVGTNTEIGGFYEALENLGNPVEVIPGLAAWAVASGPIKKETLEELVAMIIEPLKNSLPVDGVFLSLHGSLISEEHDDCDGLILEMVRKTVGFEVPVVCSLDFHAIVTERMLKNANILVGYRTYPHVDMGDTGRRAAFALIKLVSKKPQFEIIFKRVPMVLPVDNTETVEGPMADVMKTIIDWQKRPEVFNTSAFCTHTWVDVKGHGIALLAYVDISCLQEMERELSLLSDNIWARRMEFIQDYPDVEDFFARIDQYERPVAIVDSGDITTAGGAGDSTVLLRKVLSKKGQIKSAIPIVDAFTLEKAWAVGEGRTINCSVGGSDDENAYNLRVSIRAKVKRLSDKPFEIKGTSFSGMKLDVGRRALLQVEENIFLMVIEFTSMMNDPEFWRSMGLEPESMDFIVQKSHKLFRAAYADIVNSDETVDTPGCTDRNVKRLPYTKINRPIFPLDDINHY